MIALRQVSPVTKVTNFNIKCTVKSQQDSFSRYMYQQSCCTTNYQQFKKVKHNEAIKIVQQYISTSQFLQFRLFKSHSVL